MGVHRVLVSLLDFKSSVACQKRARWVRFPHAPAKAIPNQAMLLNTIVLQEAQSSSEIENIITTTDALFRALTVKTSQVDAATKEVLRYREALSEAYRAIKKRPLLTTNLFIKIYQTIKENRAGIRNDTSHLIEKKNGYYRLLRNVTAKGDWES